MESIRSIVVGVAFAIVPSLASAAEPGSGGRGPSDDRSTQIEWVGSFDRAFALAAERRVPVFLAINMDEEVASEETALRTYRDAKLVAATRDVVALVASAYGHREVEVAGQGGPRRVCSRFGVVSCAEHKDVERAMRKAYFSVDEPIVSPQHLAIAPDRTLLLQRPWVMAASELRRFVEDGIAFVRDPRKAERAEEKRLLDALPAADASHAERRLDALREIATILRGLDPAERFGLVEKRATVQAREEIVRHLDDGGEATEPPLALFLDDASPKVREKAAAALADARSDEGKEALRRRLGVEKVAKVRAALEKAIAGTP